MRESLDRIFLPLSILTFTIQVAILFFPNIPLHWQLVPLIFLLLCTLYFVVIRSMLDTSEAKPTAKQEWRDGEVDDGHRTYRYSAARYGIGYDDLDVECLLHDNGSATVTRRVRVEAFSQIEKLDTYLVIPEQPQEGHTWDIDLLEVGSLFPGTKVSLLEISEAQGRLSALLGIAPPLIKGQQVKYEMREELPPSLYAIDLTDEERAKRKKPYDYFGWTISRPTRKLELKVFFPQRIRPEGYGIEVRYASAAPGIPAETFQLEEQRRLTKPSLYGPQADRFCLRLEVEYPMTGLVYILRWEPLRRGLEKRLSAETPNGPPSSVDLQEKGTKKGREKLSQTASVQAREDNARQQKSAS